jgi:anti-sigma regulatory factor (Ser/Thr protein kinase)
VRIHLPNSAFLGNIDPFLRSFDPSNPDELIISSNNKWVSVHPMVIAMVATLGKNISPEKLTFKAFEARSKHYFERIGLFKFLGINSGISITKHDPSGRFIPLTRINNSTQQSKFITEMIPLLHLVDNPKQAQPIQYIVGELVRNVIEHSQAKDGAIVCAQYYKKSNTIRIGIVDGGVGIKKTITQSHAATDDFEAIRLALMPGITGTTKKEGGTAENAGAGLFFIKSIAHVNRDFFLVYSGKAMYKLLKRSPEKEIALQSDPLNDRHSKEKTLPYWNGTAVGIDIALDNTKEFSILLDLIRKTYSTSIRERRREKYRKPKFT